MKLSTKGRYAVTALTDMAMHVEEGAADRMISLSEISERQDISLAYLEQLFARLRRAGLVESARGPGGGYRLARPPAETRISEIMTAVDESLRATKCQDKIGQGCAGSREACLTHDLWEQLSAQMHVYLHGVTLADVAGKKLSPCAALPNFAALLEEDDDFSGDHTLAAKDGAHEIA